MDLRKLNPDVSQWAPWKIIHDIQALQCRNQVWWKGVPLSYCQQDPKAADVQWNDYKIEKKDRRNDRYGRKKKMQDANQNKKKRKGRWSRIIEKNLWAIQAWNGMSKDYNLKKDEAAFKLVNYPNPQDHWRELSPHCWSLCTKHAMSRLTLPSSSWKKKEKEDCPN